VLAEHVAGTDFGDPCATTCCASTGQHIAQPLGLVM
jgi:hypothetical protein